MNRFLTFLLFILSGTIHSCSEENSCFQSSGKEVTEMIYLNAFSNIDIPAGVDVELIPSSEYKLEIQSYENRIHNFHSEIKNKTLVIENDETNCSLLHRYKTATLKIHTPTLDSIFSRTQFNVYSKEVLTYPRLFIISSLPHYPSSSFDLKIENEYIEIEDNLVGYFKMVGKTDQLSVLFYGGSSTVDARNLKAASVYLYHRSNNHIQLHPIYKIEGSLLSTGDAQLFNCPDQMDISLLYKGKWICMD